MREGAQLFDCEVFIRIRAYGGSYVKGRKSARGGTVFLTAKYSYAYVHTASVSENRNGASQNNQNISEAKYFVTSREQFRALVHPQKKLHPQFRESPVYRKTTLRPYFMRFKYVSLQIKMVDYERPILGTLFYGAQNRRSKPSRF